MCGGPIGCKLIGKPETNTRNEDLLRPASEVYHGRINLASSHGAMVFETARCAEGSVKDRHLIRVLSPMYPHYSTIRLLFSSHISIVNRCPYNERLQSRSSNAHRDSFVAPATRLLEQLEATNKPSLNV